MEFYKLDYFSNYGSEQIAQITTQINKQSDSYLLNVSVDDYVEYLYSEWELDIPCIKFDERFIDTVEKDIPKNMFPRYTIHYFGNDQGTIRKQVIIFHLPYEGDIKLLQYIPNPRTLSTYKANVDKNQKCILIEVVNFYDDPEKINWQYNEELRRLTTNYPDLISEIRVYNQNLKSLIMSLINERKQVIINKNNLLMSLGVPIKEKNNIPKTFSVPNPKLRDKIVVKPVVYDNSFKPEPSLDDINYHKILRIINDVGKNFERMPSTYKGKSEEDIRDHILMILDPNFELGSAGGETFNTVGKTDISLRYESSVVFIAECKYWKGEKSFLKTIDQLLSYLNWRDSKTAIINFVQNKEFTDVLSKIKLSVKDHPNFLKELGTTDQTWFNYKFHLNNDRNREIDVAVVSFHLPV
ncbi:hypothetical protein D3C87_863950 [compost metagenome]